LLILKQSVGPLSGQDYFSVVQNQLSGSVEFPVLEISDEESSVGERQDALAVRLPSATENFFFRRHR
jgi:hypothetical protein